jgi:hypothetical protein
MEKDFTYFEIEPSSLFAKRIYLLHRSIELQQGMVYCFYKAFRPYIWCPIHSRRVWQAFLGLIKDGKPFIIGIFRSLASTVHLLQPNWQTHSS